MSMKENLRKGTGNRKYSSIVAPRFRRGVQ